MQRSLNKQHLKPVATPRVVKSGYVYLFLSTQPSGMQGRKIYKIGCSKNPLKRIETFNRHAAFPVLLVKAWETFDMYGMENRLQEEFKSRRMQGEWFSLTSKDLKRLRSFLARNPTRKRYSKEEHASKMPRLVKKKKPE